jgi:hypothetical protein
MKKVLKLIGLLLLLGWPKKNVAKMEVSTLKSKGIDLNVPCVSQKFNTDGNSTKSNVHLVGDYKVLKTLCSTCPYGITTNDLKQVEDLVSFLFELLKCSLT